MIRTALPLLLPLLIAACGDSTSTPARRTTPPDRARSAGPRTPPGLTPALAARLKAIWAKVHSRDPAVREEGLAGLDRLIKAHPRQVGVAREIGRWPSTDAVVRALTIWARLPAHPRFVATVKALSNHPRDAVRRAALRTAIRAPVSAAKRIVPALIKASRDPSCNVRHAALRSLRHHAAAAGVDLRSDVERALKDRCPLLQAWGATQAARMVDVGNPGASLTALLRGLAGSPYAQARCAALLALGRLRVKAAEKTMAHALLEPRSTSLVVYDTKPRAEVTHKLREASIPACAARALTLLHRKPRVADARAEVRAWRKSLRRRHRLPAPPRAFCLAARHCNASEVCYQFSCRTVDKAVDPYWSYVHRRHCANRKDEPDQPWHDFTDPVYRAAGFGLDDDGPRRIAESLKQADHDAYDEKRKEVVGQACK